VQGVAEKSGPKNELARASVRRCAMEGEVTAIGEASELPERGGLSSSVSLIPAINVSATDISPASSLRVDVLWTLAGSLFYTGCQWGCSIAIAKLADSEALGQFSLGLAVAAPIFLTGSLQLRSVQATDARREYSFCDYLSLRIITTLLAVALVSLITFGGITIGSFTRTTALVVLIVGCAKAVESISDIFFGLLQQRERMRMIALSMITKGVGSLILVVAVLSLSKSIVLASSAMLLCWSVVLFSRDIPNGVAILRDEKRSSDWLSTDTARIARLFRSSFPLGVMLLLISLGPAIPRFFLASSRGLSELGMYSAISYTIIAGQTVIAAIGQAASPRLSRLFLKGDLSGYYRLMIRLSAIALCLGILGIAISVIGGGTILRLMYAPDYAPYSPCLVVVMIAALFQYLATVIEYGVTAARVFREQVAPAVVALVVTSVAAAILIPPYGLMGGCLVLLVGQIVTLIGRLFVLWYAIRNGVG